MAKGEVDLPLPFTGTSIVRICLFVKGAIACYKRAEMTRCFAEPGG